MPSYISWMAALRTAGTETVNPPLLQLRRAQRLAAVVIILVVGLSCAGRPAPGLTGWGLTVSLALLALIGTSAFLVSRPDSPFAAIALAGQILASCSLIWLQPHGTAEPGLFVAVALAGTHLADRPSLGALGLGASAYLVPAMHTQKSPGMIAATEMGIIAFYLVARFGRSAAEAHQRANRMLLELQASRNAEAEAAALRERGRLARDMHDVLAHSLSGLMLQIEGARMLARQPDANGQLPRVLDRAHHLARAGLDDARRAISALRDEELPGPDRLGQLARDFEQDSLVRTSFEVGGTPRELDSETSLTIYRVAQEALTNVRRHAAPEFVHVRLEYEDGGTRLVIRDRAERSPEVYALARSGSGGYGLTGMQERAELLGGSLLARPTLGGFEVELWVPA